jgi:predicted Zn-dependent protease
VLKFQFAIPENWQRANFATQVIAADPNGQAQVTLSGVQQSSAPAAAQAFAAQQGVTVRSSGNVTVNGLRGTIVQFTATSSENQQLAGEVLYVEHGGTVYQFLGLTLANLWNTHGRTLDQIVRSFGPTATNQAFRRVREIDVITLSANTTPATLASRSNNAATAQEIALINGALENETLPAGRKVKTIRWR